MRINIDLDARDAMGAPGVAVELHSDEPTDMPGSVNIRVKCGGLYYTADEIRELFKPQPAHAYDISYLLCDNPFHRDTTGIFPITPEETAIKDLAHFLDQLAERVARLERLERE